MASPTKDEIQEVKVYLEGVLHAHVVMEQMGNCKKCGKREDLRGGLCFDCSVPACIRTECPFRKLVYCNQGRKQVWADMTYIGMQGKTYCDRDEGVCSDREYVIAMDKPHPPVSNERIQVNKHSSINTS